MSSGTRKDLLLLILISACAVWSTPAVEAETVLLSQQSFGINDIVGGGYSTIIGQTFQLPEPALITEVEAVLSTSLFGSCEGGVRMGIWQLVSPEGNLAQGISNVGNSTNIAFPESLLRSIKGFRFTFESPIKIDSGRQYFWGTSTDDVNCSFLVYGVSGDAVSGQPWMISGDVHNSENFPTLTNLFVSPVSFFGSASDFSEVIFGDISLARNLNQLKSDGATILVEGDTTTDGSVTFQALLDSALSNQVKLQVELRQIAEPFTGNFDGGVLESDSVLPGSVATISRSNLADAPYRWRVRVIDSEGNASAWTEFGAGGNVDFFVDAVKEFSHDVLYSQPTDSGGGPSTQFGSHERIIAETFLVRNTGFITSATLYVKYANCRRPIQVKIFTVFPDGVNGIPDIPLATSLNAPADNDLDLGTGGSFFDFYPITWNFDGTVLLEENRLYALQLEWFPGDQEFNCFGKFLGNGNVTNSKLYRKSGTNWQFITDQDFKVTVMGTPAGRDPVVIVPGIMGSRLNRVSDGEEVWPRAQEMADSSSDDYLSELKLNEDGRQAADKQMRPTSIIDKEIVTKLGIPTTEIYAENLINNLLNQGYASGTTLFTVPYDWRLDIREEISRLDEKIQQALANSPTGKVNIIAHSMGGLLVKEYLANATSTNFVGKLILAGVPQLGAPRAFNVLNYGDNLDFEFGPIDILNPGQVKIISQNMPGVYELLPSRRYIQVNGSYVKDFRDGAKFLDYEQTEEFMLSDSADSRNPALLDLTDDFHQALDNEAVNVPNVYNIVGCQNPETIGEFRIYDGDVIDITIKEGDGTVPLTSAMNFANNFQNYFVRYNQTGINHNGLIRDERTVDLITEIIQDEPIDLPLGISTSTASCFETLAEPPVNETTIMFATYSPVELHVYDSQNRHTGPLPNGDIELGVPLSSYDRIGESSFAFVPGGEIYRVVADGTASGDFDLKVETFSGSSLLNLISYLSVPLQSSETVAKLDFSTPQGDLGLRVDNNGDGVVDNIQQPTAILSATEAADINPPEIAISSPEARDYLRFEQLPVDVRVVDTESGVAFERIRFDDRMISSTSTVDLFLERLGSHTVRVDTSDRVGNPSHREVTFLVTATLESTIADIERAFSLGWIDNHGIKVSLVKKINANSLKAFLNELEAQKGKHINDQAYGLLKEDTLWLLSN